LSDSFRNGLLAFAAAAAAVIIVSLAIVLATDRGGGDNGRVDEPASVTPAVLGDTQTPGPSLSP
jgi:hypothetical protein